MNKNLSDDGEAGYRAGVRPCVHVDLGQCRNTAAQEQRHALSQAETEPYNRPIKGLSGGVILLAILAALVLIALGVGAWMVMAP